MPGPVSQRLLFNYCKVQAGTWVFCCLCFRYLSSLEDSNYAGKIEDHCLNALPNTSPELFSPIFSIFLITLGRFLTISSDLTEAST